MESDKDIVLGEEDLQIFTESKSGYVSACDKGYTVALDTFLTPELIREGYEREIVSKIQSLRKEAGFEVTDRIYVYYTAADGMAKSVLAEGKFASDVLAAAVKESSGESGYTKEADINGEKATLTLVKAK